MLKMLISTFSLKSFPVTHLYFLGVKTQPMTWPDKELALGNYRILQSFIFSIQYSPISSFELEVYCLLKFFCHTSPSFVDVGVQGLSCCFTWSPFIFAAMDKIRIHRIINLLCSICDSPACYTFHLTLSCLATNNLGRTLFGTACTLIDQNFGVDS